MPYSYSKFKDDFREHLKEKFSSDIKILDVGAGSGSYWELLRNDFKNIDAIEIFANYVSMFNLEGKYNKVFIDNILKFNFSEYDYLIMGDVIEHINVIEARNLISKITNSGKKCMVAIPYMYEQGIEFDNIFEIHQQPDLTKDIFLQRYSQMNFLFGDENYGYFINY